MDPLTAAIAAPLQDPKITDAVNATTAACLFICDDPVAILGVGKFMFVGIFQPCTRTKAANKTRQYTRTRYLIVTAIERKNRYKSNFGFERIWMSSTWKKSKTPHETSYKYISSIQFHSPINIAQSSNPLSPIVTNLNNLLHSHSPSLPSLPYL